MLGGITARVERAQVKIKRATLVPQLVRFGIAFSFVVAMSVAWPAAIVAGRWMVPLFLVAVYPAFAPRGRGTTVAILVVVAGWLADTSYNDNAVVLWRVLAIATLIYLGHTLAALAAVLPTDAAVNAEVPVGWLVRAGAVILVSAVLTVVALGLADTLAGPAFVVATLVGLGAAVGATLLLVRLLRRTGN